MAKVIHTMIRVLDEEQSVGFYRAAFGLEIADSFPFEGFTLVYLRNPGADFELELTINNGWSEPYQLGDSYGHVAFAVDDLAQEHERFERLGFSPTAMRVLSHEGQPLARFFFVQDPDGYKIEVLQRRVATAELPRSAKRPEQCPDFLRESIGLLHGREMSASLHHAPELDVAEGSLRNGTRWP
jgi:lactoylglutathione lyase